MSEDMNIEYTEIKYLGKKAVEQLVENVNNRVDKALVDKISYNAQTLTDEQKAQARENIGAASDEEYVPVTTAQIDTLFI